MGIRADVSGLHPQQLVEMFVWDDRPIGGANVIYWYNGIGYEDQPITWQGIDYQPFPVEADGFEYTASGTLPRPTLKVSNIGGFLAQYLRTIAGGLKAKVTRKRTLGKYLDAVNFPDGNPNQFMPDEIFYVSRKANENPIFVELELAVAFDAEGIRLPRRQVIAGTCQWVYRGPECGYTGPPVQDITGNPTSNPNLDRCRKTLTACKARFGEWGILPTSAFPASLLQKY
jgi:lambda family phage minor tail protein L